MKAINRMICKYDLAVPQMSGEYNQYTHTFTNMSNQNSLSTEQNRETAEINEILKINNSFRVFIEISNIY